MRLLPGFSTGLTGGAYSTAQVGLIEGHFVTQGDGVQPPPL